MKKKLKSESKALQTFASQFLNRKGKRSFSLTTDELIRMTERSVLGVKE